MEATRSPFDQKRIVITGGCGDIGQAVARRFLKAGAYVVLADITPVDVADKIVQELGSANVAFHHCDTTSSSSISAVLDFIQSRWGGIDVGISNAGMVANAPLLEANESDWRRTLDVNLTGSFQFARLCAQRMVKNVPDAFGRRGVLLFTGSWVGQMPWPGGVSYCTSKAGLEMMVKVAAQELASHQILCNLVSPGIVYAGLSRKIYDEDPLFRHRVAETIPLGRMSQAEEVAGSFLFLAGPDGAYITGTTLLVDGGASLVRRE